MNRYRFEEIEIGMEESFEVKVTSEMMELFFTITSDSNPLHTDEAFARRKGYASRISYGMLTASFLSTLAGVYMPGERSLIHSVETKFVKPVYPEDVLKICGVVAEKNELFSMIKLKVTVTNQNHEKVLRGTMQIGVLADGE
ncbi:MAG: MaoC family dehydratase N-terminal domain-containing protein [Lachnospiraceae bacterium]|nr:MaoC family dehydratase N-terminal domain-containing protein [Lachnospiraceae bacterium]